MRDLNRNTKKAQELLNNYYDSDWYDISEAYGRMSNRKLDAWNDCKELMQEYNGRGLKVCTKNKCFFSAGFNYAGEDENGMEHNYLIYITKTETFRIKLN